METSADSIPWRTAYKLIIGAIVPRPIGWVSTVDAEGVPNLAPFSFFTAVCANPPTLLFCPMIRSTDVATKDTLENVRQTGEFVVNAVTDSLGPAMNLTSTELPPGANEFVLAGLTPTGSQAVRAPRVAESPIHFECVTNQIVDIGAEAGAGSVVIGRIVHIHVDDSLLIDGDKIDQTKFEAIGRLGGPLYARLEDQFAMERPPTRLEQGKAGS